MTIAIDSETPISHPRIFITASKLKTTIPTQKTEIMAYIRLAVAINRMMKVNTPAITMPWRAAVMKALSVSIQAHQFPAVCSTDVIESGAVARYLSK